MEHELEDGCRYTGQWENGMHGVGVKVWPDGSKYEGQFKNGKMSGQGTLRYSLQGDMYEAEPPAACAKSLKMRWGIHFVAARAG